MSTAEDFLMGGGVLSAKFPAVGTTVGGPIVRVGEPIQQRDFATGQPKFWEDGQPMMQLPVEVQTSLRDPEVPDDDGVRCLFIKGLMRAAIRDAVRTSGAKALAVGGELYVTYARDGEAKRKNFDPPKEYTAIYRPPAPQAANTFLGTNTGATSGPNPATNAQHVSQPTNLEQSMAGQPAQPPAWAQPQPPAPQPAPTPVPAPAAAPAAQYTPEQLAALQQAGIDPATLRG